MDVVAAAAPDPLLLEVLGPLGGRAPARVELAVPATPGHTMHDAGRGDSVGERGLA